MFLRYLVTSVAARSSFYIAHESSPFHKISLSIFILWYFILKTQFFIWLYNLPGTAHAVPTLVLGSCSSGHSVTAQNTWERNPVRLQLPQVHGYIRHLKHSWQEQIYEVLHFVQMILQHDSRLKQESKKTLAPSITNCNAQSSDSFIHPSIHCHLITP